jgi:predicted Zn-dependent peptidase
MQQYTLDNGARVILAPFDGTSAAAVLVLFRVGSRNEDLPVWGGSHFIEHLMFKGTTRRPETIDISKELDRYGAQYNAYTGKDLTGYWVKIAGEHLPVAVDLLHDMLFHSKFDAEEMEREKKVIIEEIKMYEENPIMHIEDMLEEAMFDGHVLGRNIAGTPESMMAMRREDVLLYRDAFYHPENMVIVVSGNISAEAQQAIEGTFGKVQRSLRQGYKANESLPISKHVGLRLRRQYKDNKQIQMMLGFPGLHRGHADEYAAKLLATILGGTMSSRLFIEVREKLGLCYSIRSAWDAYDDIGMFTVRAGLDAERLPLAMTTIIDQLKKVALDGVTADELQMVKDNLRGSLALQLEDSSDRAEFYGRQALFLEGIENPSERLAHFSAVTVEDIGRVARDILRLDDMALSIIGPYQSDDEVLSQMNIR